MENKRKVKINKYYNQLKEEKDDLFDLIERHVNQVFCCVEKINSGDVNQKDLHKFLEFELKLIQKLEEFSFELESLQSECPIKNLIVEECESHTNNSTNVSNVREIPTQTDVETHNSMYDSSIDTEIPTHDNENLLEISENFRQTLRTVSHKLGLNNQNLTSMRNFYEKPLNTCVIGFTDTPSVYLPDDYYPIGSETYLIPEKDESSNIHPSQKQMTDGEQGISEVQPIQFQENTDSNSTDIGSSEESDCSVGLGNPNTPNIAGFRNYNKPCTAIEKLNNFKSSDKKDSLFDVKPLELPNLALTPIDPVETQSQTVIRNFETPNKTTKKKNNLDKSLTFDLKPKDVPAVDDICVICHIETPSDFYINLVDGEVILLDKISKDIANIALNRRTYKSKEEAHSDIQKYGVVYITAQSNWYRMEVLNWYNEYKHGNVLVRLVDFGSTHIVSFDKLGRLTKSLAEIPMLAIHCHFPLMYPPESTPINLLTHWPQDTIAQFKEISGIQSENVNENLFKIAYSSWNPILNAVEIDLIHIDEPNEEHTVGQILLNLGLAVQIVEEYDEDETEIGEFLQDVDTLEAAENINEAVTGYDARDEARICRFTKPDGTCFKGKNCKLEHLPLSKDGYTTDKDVVFREAMYSLLLPKLGEYVMVLITSYKNICNFFVQLIRQPVNEKSYVVDQDFQRLMQDINSPKVLKTHESFKVAPAIGEMVLVKHWSTQWLRGVVRDFDTNSDGDPFNFQVFAVDYGETLKNLKSCDLRKIKPQYLQLPFQAVECYMKDYEFNDGCAFKDAKYFFDRNLYFHNFMATVLSSSLPFGILLGTMDGTINVGQSLKQRGFAKKRTYDINPSEDCPLDLL